MIYITYQDLINKVKDNILLDIIELDSGTTSGTTTENSILNETEKIAIDTVSASINQYYDLGLMLSLTGDTRDYYLIQLIVDIMLYEISSRLTFDNIPTIRQLRYDKCKEELLNIAKRELNPNWPTRNSNIQSTSSFIYSYEEKTNTNW